MATGGSVGRLRPRGEPNAVRVSFAELFYDLVFVFAITQLSHLLLHHYTLLGALETLLLVLAVWWVWIYMTWVLNWLDPRAMAVRIMLYGSMLLGLFLSMSIPGAFAERGLAFAAALVGMQLGRALFAIWALASDGGDARVRNFKRIAVWFAASGVFWIAGGVAEGETRLALWSLAIAIEYLGPAFSFFVPRLGRSLTSDWDVLGEHIAERCALFVIICLGETLLISGATFADAVWDRAGTSAFVVNFALAVAMWWIYFHIGQERASRLIESSYDPGRIARIAFTYAHLPIVAGIVVSAVAAELVIAHPDGHTTAAAAASILGGPGLFIAGNLWFKAVTSRVPPLSHIVGLGLLAASAFAVPYLSPLLLSVLTLVILVVVAAWERISLGAPGQAEQDRV